MSPPADPFAAAKANLRDTVKWLVTIFAGLATAVTAGASLTGIASVDADRQWVALAGGAIGVICLYLAAGMALRLLTSESYFLGDLDSDPYIKEKLEGHALDILPPAFATLDEFLQVRRRAAATAQDPAVSFANQKSAANYFSSLEPATSRLVNLAQFEALRRSFIRAEWPLFGLASAALVGLMVFAVFSGVPKKPDVAATSRAVMEFAPGRNWSEVSAALTQACGDAAPLKAQVLGLPQKGWVELRLLGPDACSGMTISLPAHVVARPSP